MFESVSSCTDALPILSRQKLYCVCVRACVRIFCDWMSETHTTLLEKTFIKQVKTWFPKSNQLVYERSKTFSIKKHKWQHNEFV